MTLSAPQSRRGIFSLSLVILAALVALAGALLWISSASAAPLPNTTIELDQTPNGPGTVAPGSPVSYTASATITTPLTVGDDLTLELDYNATALVNEFVVCSAGTAASGVGTGTAFCNWDTPVAAGTYSITVSGLAGATLPAPAARVCSDAPASNSCAQESGSSEEVAQDVNPADTGILTVDGASLVTATPDTADNFPGTQHTVTFSFPANVDCAINENVNFPNSGQTDRDCIIGDVNLICADAGITTVVSVTMVGDTNIDLAQDVQVVIENDGSGPNDCTISIDGVTGTGNGVADDNVFFTSEVVVKNYVEVTGEIRHLDEADAASEDAAGNPDGILPTPDDNDDAIGSFHQACIIGSPLTHADRADITWTINNGPGSSATVASVAEVAGPNNEPCVRWGSAGTGTQTIQASWDNGIAPAVDFFFDSELQLPLIKEWNDIDSTSIVFTDGNVGDTLADNTGSLANWSGRDTSFHQNANQDGTTVEVECSRILGPVGFGNIDCSGESFIDYTFGNHSDAGGAYDGPIDGAEQTYSVSGDCGSVRLEDPTTGIVHILYPGDSVTVLSSDKGVGFQILPNDEGALETTPSNADCGPGSSITVDITTVEDNLFTSPPLDTADDETITVTFDVAPPGNKQPQLAWAGMRVVLEHNWGNDEQGCPWSDGQSPFYVRYTKQFGNGALISDLGDGIAYGPDFMVVEVNPSNNSKNGIDPWGEANSDCISRVIYETQDNGEQDIVAHVVEPQCPDVLDPTFTFPPMKTANGVGGAGRSDDFDAAGCDWSVVSEQVAFVVYYMKLEEVTLGIVPGEREDHNSGDFDADGNINDASADGVDTTANVSADVLVRVRVKGWLERTNCPARESGVDSNGGFLPANRCIFPDDWEYIAGGDLAEEFRPNYDIMREPGVNTNINIGCDDAPVAAGPFSWLDGFDCGDSSAPNSEGTTYRETIFPDGDVDEWDAPMPPSLIRLLLTGSGFIRPADKDSIYPEPSNLYYVTNIPAEPWITPINEDLTGYLWNSWGSGAKSGHYEFWTSLADKSSAVVSCPGASPCDDGVATGGYTWIKIYTDNHGEAMAYVNGDANLTFDDCDTSAGSAGNAIVQLSGYYCEDGETVGTSTLTAAADYPDKRKHEPLDSPDVSITWEWGGTKEVLIVPGANAQFNYVVLSVTDRDEQCDSTTSLHPVLGELVEFQIDSPDGIIFPDANGNDAEGPPATVDADKKGADTHTFQSGGDNADITLNTGNEGDCQAWIHISSSLLGTVNVIIIAHDPEGTVTFDVVVNPPTPVPTPVPTPEPTSPPPPHLFGDNDCDDDVDSVDALQGLRFAAGLEVFQTGPCHALDSDVTVDGDAAKFGDWNCDGDVDLVDQQAILRFVSGMSAIAQNEPCADVGSAVTIA